MAPAKSVSSNRMMRVIAFPLSPHPWHRKPMPFVLAEEFSSGWSGATQLTDFHRPPTSSLGTSDP
jgi:hypothetical protein